MQSHDLVVDVSGVSGLDGELQTVATVHLPDEPRGQATVLVGFPGGGYGRRYFDITTQPGYSQAAHHTDRGFVFVACDHLGVGDSSQPDPFSLTYENLAAVNHATVEAVRARLETGTVADGVPPVRVARTLGMGQSMGGCLLTVQQSAHRTFEAVAFLGWSGVYTNFPAANGGRVTFPLPPRGTNLRDQPELLQAIAPTTDHFRFCFHWPDEDPALVEADLASYRPFSDVRRGGPESPWGSETVPVCAVTMMTEGAVREEAARIDVPVLVVSGERDVIPNPRAEPLAYASAPDVAVCVVPRMAHMHNFARSRTHLWDRITHFAATPCPPAS